MSTWTDMLNTQGPRDAGTLSYGQIGMTPSQGNEGADTPGSPIYGWSGSGYDKVKTVGPAADFGLNGQYYQLPDGSYAFGGFGGQQKAITDPSQMTGGMEAYARNSAPSMLDNVMTNYVMPAAATFIAGGNLGLWGGAPGAAGMSEAGADSALANFDAAVPASQVTSDMAGVTAGTANAFGPGVGPASAPSFLDNIGNSIKSGWNSLTNAISPTVASTPGNEVGVPGMGSSAGTGLTIPGPAPVTAGAPLGGGPSTASGGGFMDFLKANKNLILPGAALAGSMFSTPKSDTSNLEAIAAKMGGQNSAQAAAEKAATDLIPSVSTGNLPPGASAGVHQALNAAVQSIKSKYAQMGLSGSTMEQQEISAANQSAATQAFNLANQLTQTGLTAAGISSAELGSQAAIYDAIMKAQLQADSGLQSALANFAAAGAYGYGSGKALG